MENAQARKTRIKSNLLMAIPISNAKWPNLVPLIEKAWITIIGMEKTEQTKTELNWLDWIGCGCCRWTMWFNSFSLNWIQDTESTRRLVWMCSTIDQHGNTLLMWTTVVTAGQHTEPVNRSYQLTKQKINFRGNSPLFRDENTPNRHRTHTHTHIARTLGAENASTWWRVEL